MKEIIELFREWAQFKYAGFRLTIAIKIADAKQAATNKQYFVLPIGTKLQAFCPDDINLLKRTKVYSRKQITLYKQKQLAAIRSQFPAHSKEYSLATTALDKNVSLMAKARVIDKHAQKTDFMKECYYYTSASLNDKNRITDEELIAKRKQWLQDYQIISRKLNK